jgi:hypothetical protein
VCIVLDGEPLLAHEGEILAGVRRLDLRRPALPSSGGKVKVHYSGEPLDEINSIFARMRDNRIDERVVMRV